MNRQITDANARYFEGHATGDPEVMRRAFHPDARLQFIRDGEYRTWSLEEYLKVLPGTPAPDEARRTRTIVSVAASGDAAMATVELDYPAQRFVDYMSLLYVGGDWTIVNKIFQVFPKEPAPEG